MLFRSLVWRELQMKIEAALRPWNQCYLSLQGRAYVAQTVGMGLLRYRLNSLAISSGIIQRFKSIFSNFIWNGKRDFVDRRTMSLPKREGGRGAPLVKQTIQWMRMQLLQRTIYGSVNL